MYYFLLYNETKKKIFLKIKNAKNFYRDNLVNYLTETRDWIIKQVDPIVFTMVQDKNLTCDIIYETNLGLKKNNQEVLHQYIMKILSTLQKSFDDKFANLDKESNILKFFCSIAQEGKCLPDGFMLDFELNRLSYSIYGSLQNVSQDQSKLVIGMIIFVKIIINQYFSQFFNIHRKDIPEPSATQKYSISSLAAYFFHIFCQDYQKTMQIIPGTQENIILSKKTTPFPENYFYWPDYSVNNTEGAIRNFKDGEQDVLVGAPDTEAMQVMYNDEENQDEAADKLEIFLIILHEKIQDYEKKQRKLEMKDKIVLLKNIAVKMKKTYPIYALRIEFNVNKIIEDNELDMEKFVAL